MSTWWYLECTSHDPVIQSPDEVEQHTYGLPKIREVIARRATLTADSLEALGNGFNNYFERNAVRFLIQHPKCSLQLVSEYGDIETLPPPEEDQ